MFNNLTFYTDSGCSGNPGPGGFGIINYKNLDTPQKIVTFNFDI